jgi:(p)ppGpp synthase/HD superfamily hydrolase
MNPVAQARLVEALAFALEAHGAQTRKGRDIPYASHLLQVAGLVLEHGGDVELAAAAMLHDTLEDCDRVDDVALRKRFGERVTRVVIACSDLLPGDGPETKSPWTLRKRRYLAQLRDAEGDAHLVAACDKLHNLRSLLADLEAEGAATLDRFTARPEQTRAYHEAVREIVAETIPDALRREFDTALTALARWVPHSRLDDE